MTHTGCPPNSPLKITNLRQGDLIRFTGYYQRVLGSYEFIDKRAPTDTSTEVVDQWEWVLTAKWHSGIVTEICPGPDSEVLYVLSGGERVMLVAYPQEDPWSEGSIVELVYAGE